MENERMTQAEQAVLLWPLLALAARTQQILSYAAVEGYSGIARHGLNRALGLIHDYCKRRGWPLLNTLVVSQQSEMPGEGFPEDLSSLEIKVEQGRVFLFDWPGHDKTTAPRFSGCVKSPSRRKLKFGGNPPGIHKRHEFRTVEIYLTRPEMTITPKPSFPMVF